MILADKILSLRKNNGWSQEELAEKMNVSRQSVSKWESAAAIPDINRILEMAKLFGVTTDYLLKDDLETMVYSEADETDNFIRVSLQEMNDFLKNKAIYGTWIARGVMLCILSPIFLILLPGLSEADNGLTENAAVVIGLTMLLLMVSSAVGIFIVNGAKMERFQYLETNDFELEYGLVGIIKEKKAGFAATYIRNITIGVILCILSTLPLIIAAIFEASSIAILFFTSLLLVIVSVGVYLIIAAGTIKDSYDQLLGEGDYEEEKQENEKQVSRFGGVYWPIVTAIYLGWSFYSNNWGFTWVIWPVAGLIFAGIASLFYVDKR